MTVDLFATPLNHCCSLYFSPFHDSSSIGTDAFLQNWDGYQLYAFPPWSMIPLVLKKLKSSSGPHDSHCSILAPEALVSGPSGFDSGQSNQSSSLSRSQTTPFPLPSSGDPQAVPSCLVTIKRFAKSKGFSSHVAKQVGFACHSSSIAVYQAKWSVYRS